MYSRVRRYTGARKRSLGAYKKYSKSNYKRRRTTTIAPYQRLPYFPSYLSDVPPVKYAKLRYVVHENTNGPALNNLTIREFRINGLYDPEVGLGGHQPCGFDELMKQYEKFTVLKAHFTLENMSLNSNRAMFLCMIREQQPGDVAAQYSIDGLNPIFERPGISDTLGLSIGGDMLSSKRKVYMWCDMSKYVGKTYKDLIGDYGYQGDVGHDPNQQQYLAVVLFSPTGADQSSGTAQWKLTIDYYAAFTKRMPPEGS